MKFVRNDFQKKLDETSKQLTAARKARGKNAPGTIFLESLFLQIKLTLIKNNVSEGLAKPEDFDAYSNKTTHTGIHSTSVPGITALDVQVKIGLLYFYPLSEK